MQILVILRNIRIKLQAINSHLDFFCFKMNLFLTNHTEYWGFIDVVN